MERHAFLVDVLRRDLACAEHRGFDQQHGDRKRWALLHRVVYLSGILGVLHYYMLVKSDVRLPMTFAFLLAVLLGFRIFPKYYVAPPRVSNSIVPPR